LLAEDPGESSRYTGRAMRVLVTGAASGIGRATGLRLARDAKARQGPSGVAGNRLGRLPGLTHITRS
jgi:hypothetical protein